LGVRRVSKNHTAHDAVVAQVTHQRTRVDIGQHGNFELFEKPFGELLGTPVRANFGELANDKPFDIRPRGFAILGISPVVSDFGVGKNYNLTGIGRISEDFLITGDGSIKNYFAATFAFRSVAFAAEDFAVFQRKDSLHCFSGEWILKSLTGMADSANKCFYASPNHARRYAS